MPDNVSYHSSSLPPVGVLLSCGGYNDRGLTHECQQLEDGKWQISAPLPSPMAYGALVQFLGTMTWLGGVDGDGETINNVYPLSLAGEWTTA
jgi:Uncharacterized protein conserved in bacteria